MFCLQHGIGLLVFSWYCIPEYTVNMEGLSSNGRVLHMVDRGIAHPKLIKALSPHIFELPVPSSPHKILELPYDRCFCR